MKKSLHLILIFVPIFSFSTVFTTVKNGNWSDASVWQDGRIPLLSDSIFIKHEILFDEDLTVLPKGFLHINNNAVLCGYKSLKVSCGATFYNAGTVKAKNIELEGDGENAGEIYISEFMKVNNCGQMFSFGAMTIGISYECDAKDSVVPPKETELPKQISDTSVFSDSSLTGKIKIFPNPIADEFEINYVLISDARISLSVYNSSGKLIAVLSERFEKEGNRQFIVSNLNLSNGIYIVRLATEEKVYYQKFLKAE